jgi:hypothetical protein
MHKDHDLPTIKKKWLGAITKYEESYFAYLDQLNIISHCGCMQSRPSMLSILGSWICSSSKQYLHQFSPIYKQHHEQLEETII